MHLYLIRHADPCYDPDSLTETGHKEAEALAPRLQKFGVNQIYSSPLIRTQQTARYTSDLLNLPVTTVEWLKEIEQIRILQDDFRYTIWDTYGETVRGNDTLPGHYDWPSRSPYKETPLFEYWTKFREEADRFLESAGYRRENGRYRILNKNDDRIALFCHNGTILFLIAHLLEIPLPLTFSGIFCWPSSVTDIYFDERSEQWAVPKALHIADVSHLIANGLTPQARGMGDRCDEYY